MLSIPTVNKETTSASIMSVGNENSSYLILFFHFVLGYSYQTKLVSNVTNKWRHVNSTAQAFYSLLQKNLDNMSFLLIINL